MAEGCAHDDALLATKSRRQKDIDEPGVTFRDLLAIGCQEGFSRGIYASNVGEIYVSVIVHFEYGVLNAIFVNCSVRLFSAPGVVGSYLVPVRKG